MEVPLSRPDITPLEIDSVTGVLKTPHLSLGPKLGEFEEKFAAFIGSQHAVAVNSGTSALHLAVRAMGWGPGDKVITSSFSFISSANCLLFEGAVPVLVDIDPDTLNLDLDLAEEELTGDIAGLLPVHIFGCPVDMERVMRMAGAHNLKVVEDACEALGAERDGRKAGTWAAASTFAFYPNKQMTTGEGGMVVTDDEEVAAVCRSLRNQGRGQDGKWLVHQQLGYNYRLSDINCALGIAQLARIGEMLKKREQVALRYQEQLKDCEPLVLPNDRGAGKKSWFVYVVQIRGARGEQRDRVLDGLRAHGIGCNDYFRPIHLQPFYRERFGYKAGDFPVTEQVARETVALPFYNNLTEPEISYVCDTLKALLARRTA